MGILSRIVSPLIKAIDRPVGIRGADPRKGNFQWMAGLPSKKVLKPVIVNSFTIKQLSNTDPITWAIKATRKAQITQTKWDIVTDTEQTELELDRWFNNIMANMNPWGFKEVFHPLLVTKEMYARASADVEKIISMQTVTKKEKKDQLKWYFEALKRKVNQDAMEHAHIVKQIFEKPNDSETRNFRSFIELLVDDILTYDAGVIVKNYNMRDELAELYLVPGQDVKLYRNPDRTLPVPPENAYVWEDQGILRAEFTKDEIVYIVANPQQNGYGMSPIEVAAYIITASLYADEYNIDFFKHSNVPPAIMSLGKNFTPENKTSFEKNWDNEIQGRGLNRMMFLAGAEDPKYIPMRTQSSRDMQMMEYLKWTLSIKCACFQISPQDISFIQDFHRTTAETQKELTKERGIKNLLSLIETYFNMEIVKKDFPFKDVKFQWLGVDLTDERIQADIDNIDIMNGIISRNDRRKRLGMPSIEGGDVILVKTAQGDIPIEDLIPSDEAPEGQPQALINNAEEEQAKQDAGIVSDVKQQGDKAVQSAKQTMGNKQQQPMKISVKESAESKIPDVMKVLKSYGLDEQEIKIVLEK